MRAAYTRRPKLRPPPPFRRPDRLPQPVLPVPPPPPAEDLRPPLVLRHDRRRRAHRDHALRRHPHHPAPRPAANTGRPGRRRPALLVRRPPPFAPPRSGTAAIRGSLPPTDDRREGWPRTPS